MKETMIIFRTMKSKITQRAPRGVNSKGFARRPLVLINADGERIEEHAHTKAIFEVHVDGEVLLMTKREANRAFGPRKVRNAIKKGRR